MCGNWTDKTKLLMTTIRSSFVFVKFKSDHSLVFPGFKVTISTHNGNKSRVMREERAQIYFNESYCVSTLVVAIFIHF